MDICKIKKKTRESLQSGHKKSVQEINSVRFIEMSALDRKISCLREFSMQDYF